MEDDQITIRVTVYSDYTCPWCYVGSARLERVKTMLPDGIRLVDTWMPFEIHPEVPKEGMSVDQLPYSEEQFRQMNAVLREQAVEEGLPMVERNHLVNTHDALAAATFIQDRHPECFRDFHEGVFDATFGTGEDVSDPGVLRRVAEAAGVPAGAVDEALAGGAYDDAIEATGELARRLGISGTPTYVFENEFAVVGAHPVETLREAVMQVIEKKRSAA